MNLQSVANTMPMTPSSQVSLVENIDKSLSTATAPSDIQSGTSPFGAGGDEGGASAGKQGGGESSMLKSLASMLGAIPFAGPMLSGLLSQLMPGQSGSSAS